MTSQPKPGQPNTFQPKTAFVLAAGLGQRMRPLTDEIPKPLVRLAGRPLIDHVLDRLGQAGVERAIVNVHYKPAPLLAHLQRRQRAPRIEISDETDLLLDTGGGVARALGSIGADPVIIHNSDTVWIERGSANLARLIAAWDPARMDSLLLLADSAASIGYDGRGDFQRAADGAVVRRAKTETAPYVFAGVSIAAPHMFEGAPAGPFSLNVLWDRTIARGRLHGIVLDGLWMHVGTPQALLEAEERIANAARF